MKVSELNSVTINYSAKGRSESILGTFYRHSLHAQRFRMLVILVKVMTVKVSELNSLTIDDSAKGGLAQFWELFTIILCTS